MTDTEISVDAPIEKLVCEWLEEDDDDVLCNFIDDMNANVLISSDYYDLGSALQYDMFMRRSSGEVASANLW
jgi:hypothetical protein